MFAMLDPKKPKTIALWEENYSSPGWKPPASLSIMVEKQTVLFEGQRIYDKEDEMSIQPITRQVRWQDFMVVNEVEMVFEIAAQLGWDDCEIFGSGDMLTEPQESMGWDLVPADQYKYSIPAEAIGRLHHLINAGIQVKGVIIADDQRSRQEPEPEPRILLPPLKPILSAIGKVLLKVIGAVAALALVGFSAIVLLYLSPILLLCGLMSTREGATVEYDPKLVVLVDNGRGGTAWISLFTWYD